MLRVVCMLKLKLLTRMVLEGVDDDLPRMASEANMEDHCRRRLHEAFKEVQLSLDHCLFKAEYTRIKTQENLSKESPGYFGKVDTPRELLCIQLYEVNSRGVAGKLASCNYGIFAMDYPGFGLSEGLHGYIPSFDRLVDDIIEHLSKIKGKIKFT
ncbi:Caffeoylshikimate esterase [Canna indica]|uniref:Caffeoylshikimate esterase n=1 Tax=Canna indica TaxID=4628 RepID=A0AAQ3L8E8_9LILI|nr:Caffeoylshikimate esterase [Canna indica]